MVEQGRREGTITDAQIEGLHRGETTFWHRERNVLDPARRLVYQQYETAFRLLPYLPGPLRRRLARRHLTWVPKALLKPVGLVSVVADLALSPDLRLMASRYLRGLRRHLSARLGVRPKAPEPRAHGPLPAGPFASLFAAARGAASTVEDTPSPSAPVQLLRKRA
jgi:hypothetical protein